MARIYTSLRGEEVNLDVLTIKNQLAQAPMTINVAERMTFMDTQEGRKVKPIIPQVEPTVLPATPTVEPEPETYVEPVKTEKKK
jgi:hypothetical protein